MDDQPTTPDGPEESADAPSLRESVAGATERIQVIVEAAERAAAGVIEDAEVQARRYLEESRNRADRLAGERAKAMTEISDALINQAHEVKRQSDQLIAALDKARTDLEERGGGAPGLSEVGADVPLRPATPGPPREVSYLKAVEVTGDVAQSAGPSAGARLLATQMAVAGSSRDEIEQRLRSEFGIEEPGPMLDAILGPEA
jgi:hypothetical protein